MAELSNRAALSFAQQRLWFIGQVTPGSSHYNLAFGYRLRGELDVRALADAFTEIVARHEVLRTRFIVDGGEPRQVIDAPSPVRLVVTDAQEADDPVTQAHRLAEDQARAPFDLAEGPLLRARLVSLAGADHVLLLTMHHIVADGWSLNVLNVELGVLYRAFTAGRPSPLAPLEIQYADFAEWQRERLSGDFLAEQLDHWRERLRDMPPAMELPSSGPRPPQPSYVADAVAFEVPADVAQRLRGLGAERRATLFMVLLAGFDALVAGYTASSDVVVGAPVAGRDRAELEDLIGFFVNNLVLRVDTSGDPTFGELVDRVRDVTLSAFDYQELPFERLVEELRPARDPSRNPLTQIGFQLLRPEHAGRSLDLAGVEVEPFEGHGDVIHFDAELYVFDGPNELAARLVYAADVFDRTAMQRFARHFVQLLSTASADVRLSALPLTDPETRQQLIDWNATHRPVPDTTVTRLFEARAARSPNAVAVSYGAAELTYAALDRRANRFAHRLRALGVGPEVLVGLCARPGLDLAVGMLAILKAGGAYLPLDPDLPAERTAFALSDTGCRFVVVQDGLELGAAAGSGIETVRLDAEADACWPDRAPDLELSADALAYVIYTSGSTGRPKGVAVPHGGMANMACYQAREFGLGPHSRVLQVASLSFDASVSEIWITWISGGELVIARRGLVGDDLAELVAARQITQVALVPSVLATLPHVELPNLETILIGGEVAAPSLVNRWAAGRTLINVFGPTEATVNAASFRAAAATAAPLPIGRPIDNTQIFLLDRWLRPVPVGVSGEMYIGGAGVARGYVGRPGLTACRFVANPFDDGGMRLYRTGDLARFRPDGIIDFLGRTDGQVKLRGFRIELGEVESVLAEHPAVRQVAVAVRDQRMFAYVVPAGVDDVDDGGDAELREQYVGRCQRSFDEVHRRPAEPASPNRTAVERVAAAQPRRLLEIGCGGGSLMRALLPACEQYVATDFSSSAIDRLRSEFAGTGGLSLMVREATDFRGFRDGSFDAVVLDSLTQHCPELAYLDEVIHRSVDALADGAVLLVSDVRRHADAGLAIDARYFQTLPGRVARVAEVELIDHGDRYDVVLTTGPERLTGAVPALTALPGGLANDPLRAERGERLGRILREFARARLPDYMVPSGFVAVDRIPMLPNGKLDTQRLPAPALTSSGRAPENPEEKAFCALFAEVLDLGSVGPDDSFFDIGGHSLLAFRLVNLIRSRLGIEVSLGEVFAGPTPAALAHQVIRTARGEVT